MAAADDNNNDDDDEKGDDDHCNDLDDKEEVERRLYYSFFPISRVEVELSTTTAQQQPTLNEVGGKGLSLIQASSSSSSSSSENNNAVNDDNDIYYFPVPKGFILSVSWFQPWIDRCLSVSGGGGEEKDNNNNNQNEQWMSFVTKINKYYSSATTKKDGSTSTSTIITKDDCDDIKSICRQRLLESSDDSYFLTVEQKAALNIAIKEVFSTTEKDDSSSSSSLLVAIRSSSPEEDLMGTSFAGGYDTTLGVPLPSKNIEDDINKPLPFMDALITSFVSMFDYRIVQYKIQHGFPSMTLTNPKIAVVIQEQIDSQTSGVAFSINPHNNCYDEIMITANYGLGETVVSGTVSPDVYIIQNNGKKTNKDDNDDEFVILDEKIGSKKEIMWLDKNKSKNNDHLDDANKEEELAKQRCACCLSKEQILEVSKLVSNVEEKYTNLLSKNKFYCPVDVEWAYDPDGNLRLLQARPVTSYIPLYEEMITPRASSSQKRNLYLDTIVTTQGFSEPFSILGMDCWKTMLEYMKPCPFGVPHNSFDGKDCPVWHIHGRQYMNVSNIMKMSGGQNMVEKMYGGYDKRLGRSLESIDLAGLYTPDKTPPGVQGMTWIMFKMFGKMIPSLWNGYWSGSKAADQYLDWSEYLITNQDKYLSSNSDDFESLVNDSAKYLSEQITSFGGAMAMAFWSKYRVEKMFEGYNDDDDSKIDDLLVSLCMDLKGNPTSEMGHAMVKLAGTPEIQNTKTEEEFCKKLFEYKNKQKNNENDINNKKSSFTSEFVSMYDEYMMRYGCRCMKEIDIASKRTYEQPGDFFKRLKQIDVRNNAIQKVAERRKIAHEKLLYIAKEKLNKEKDFLYHDRMIQSLLGLREHPKYILVLMNSLFRKRALAIGEELVRTNRIDSKEQIFDLSIKQVTDVQKDSSLNVRTLIESNVRPIRAVEHVKNWPVLIDSRGKIIRAPNENRRKKKKTTTNGDDDDDDDENVLLGEPIAPGKVAGKAKVLSEPYEKPLLAGEILVARFTEPSWTPIFINAAAVVMEVGGPLQHGAIIAREYGIPCVSGLDDATTLIKDGDKIEVDGSSGTVTFIVKNNGDSGKNKVSDSE